MATLDELPQNCVERALWELVQNARDQAEGFCHIHIQLDSDRIIFGHKGRPFDYNSLSALVKQTSSKDNKDQVGRYGTGFMTTHSFNEIVKVQGWYEVKKEADRVEGYVPVDDLMLRRDFDVLDEFIAEMRRELDYVSGLWKSSDRCSEKGEWTKFTYDLTAEKVKAVSSQLSRLIMMMPIVMTINKTIAVCEIEDNHAHKHVLYSYDGSAAKRNEFDKNDWLHESVPITCVDYDGPDGSGAPEHPRTDTYVCHSLQSVNGDDIIIIPPFPVGCEDVDNIPSLFLWFPLIGTEKFGINFIFHSRRFHPVEKRNDIQLPRDNDKKVDKGAENELVLNQMMDALFAFYDNADNLDGLPKDFARVYIKRADEDAVREDFYRRMHLKWLDNVRHWRVIPTPAGMRCIEDDGVRVLHPCLYEKLTADQRLVYEPVLSQFARSVNGRLCPAEDLIWWSQAVNEWSYEDSRYCLTPDEICQSITDKSEILYDFLKLLKETGNDSLFARHALIPNRDGMLCTQGSLKYWRDMTDDLYDRMKVLMGNGARDMVDPRIIELDIANVGDYDVEALKKDIANTLAQWRNTTIGAESGGCLARHELDALIDVCSAFASDNPDNLRSRLMGPLVEIHGRTYGCQKTDRLMADEEDRFYKPIFNFLVEYTLYVLSKKDHAWVEDNIDMVLRFLTQYATSNKKDDWLDRLDKYAVIPNRSNRLCLLSELTLNVDINLELESLYDELYAGAPKKSLKEIWAHEKLSDVFDFRPQTKEDVAAEVEKLLLDDYRKGLFSHKKVMLRLIPLLNAAYEVDSHPNLNLKWSQLFETFSNESPKVVFNMKSGDEQKDLFKIMGNLDAVNLRRMAALAETPDVGLLLDRLEQQEQLRKDSQARFNHLYGIGKYIENQLREYIQDHTIVIDIPKGPSDVESEDAGDDAAADDEQNGQDIIIRKKNGDRAEDVYYIEVKSKWSFDEAAHMSPRQVRKAACHPDRYALCCVYLKDHKHEDLASLPIETIVECTRVKMDIGHELKPLIDPILVADKRPDDAQIKISGYRSNMSEKVFKQGVPLSNLLDRILTCLNLSSPLSRRNAAGMECR